MINPTKAELIVQSESDDAVLHNDRSETSLFRAPDPALWGSVSSQSSPGLWDGWLTTPMGVTGMYDVCR